MSDKALVHEYTVSYDDDTIHGMHYLRDHIDADEAKVFFHQAKYNGSARFEDKMGRDYTLKYQEGAYELERRH